MKRILTVDAMRRCDSAEIVAGTASATLMERAALAVVKIAQNKFDLTRVITVCGGGNNGGDGIIAAIILHDKGYNSSIYLADTGRKSAETEKRINEARERGIEFVKTPQWDSYTVIIDALLGIGADRAPAGEMLDVIRGINSSKTPVVSVDIPSGINADTGECFGEAIWADATVTIAAYKKGLLLTEGIGHSGRVYAVDIGIDTDDGEREIYVLEDSDLSLLPKRPYDANKGTFGRVLVIAGSEGMCGAAYLSAKAAYRSGAGLVEVFTPEVNRGMLQMQLPEAIVTAYTDITIQLEMLKKSLERAAVVIVGPGLSTSESARLIVRKTYEWCVSPIIIDADALNITALDTLAYPTDVPVIITPHPGEMARLVCDSICNVTADMWRNAEDYAAENDIICVLKGARSVIADGTTGTMFVNASGTPALAKGGSGDVLTGVIAGMLCAGLSPVGAASLGVFVHGRAGEIAAEKYGEYSPLAGEVCDAVADVLLDIH